MVALALVGAAGTAAAASVVAPHAYAAEKATLTESGEPVTPPTGAPHRQFGCGMRDGAHSTWG